LDAKWSFYDKKLSPPTAVIIFLDHVKVIDGFISEKVHVLDEVNNYIFCFF